MSHLSPQLKQHLKGSTDIIHVNVDDATNITTKPTWRLQQACFGHVSRNAVAGAVNNAEELGEQNKPNFSESNLDAVRNISSLRHNQNIHLPMNTINKMYTHLRNGEEEIEDLGTK